MACLDCVETRSELVRLREAVKALAEEFDEVGQRERFSGQTSPTWMPVTTQMHKATAEAFCHAAREVRKLLGEKSEAVAAVEKL